jgi:heme oxygenase
MSASLMTALREAVRDRHARMEALPFIAALTGGQLPLVSYVGQLRAMAVIHGTLEHELAQLPSPPLQAFLAGRPSRLGHLRQDLGRFDPLAVADLQDAQAPTRRIAEGIRRLRADQPIDLLGTFYVLEGTTLGNAVHHGDVLRLLAGQGIATASYYHGYGSETGRRWEAFRAAMDAVPLEPGDRDRILQVALDLFDQLEVLFGALYPPGPTCFTAAMLNPEAGDHPVPQDPRILAAALRAVTRCRAAFPYFEERFGERGRGFSQSDGAWLATLAGLPGSLVLSQVDWLGRILGNRCIPRLTLERQLAFLHEELAASGGDPGGLLQEAAAELRRQRCQVLPEDLFSRLAEDFERASASRLPGTGGLLLSALCDREAGITGALTSLLPWLTEAERFPASWRTAVAATLSQGEAALSRR